MKSISIKYRTPVKHSLSSRLSKIPIPLHQEAVPPGDIVRLVALEQRQQRAPVHVRRRLDAGDVQERRRQINVQSNFVYPVICHFFLGTFIS